MSIKNLYTKFKRYHSRLNGCTIQYELNEYLTLVTAIKESVLKFKNKSDDEILKVHETKRPILVGTQSVAESSMLAEALRLKGISCEVLNAKQNEFEARIIAEKRAGILRGDKKHDRAVRVTALSCLDAHWSAYLAEISDLRDGIHLRRIGGQDPLFEFKKLSIAMFNSLLEQIDIDIDAAIKDLQRAKDGTGSAINTPKAPSATWTYLVSDDPFRDKFEMQFTGNIGFSLWAGLLWPLTALYFAINRKRK
jgi:preprotein translocase subunit SecA